MACQKDPGLWHKGRMRDVLKTNNAVMLSFAQSILADAGIESVVFDGNMSIVEGSLGILPRRLMVADDDVPRAERLLQDGFARVEKEPSFSDDRFLGGRLLVRQRTDGFRAGLDAVMLAASIPADPGETILELGSGVGTAGLCLAERVDVQVIGAEIDPELTQLANGNAIENGLDNRAVFVTVDVFDLPSDMKRDFDHVICNPPFHGPHGQSSPDQGRALALEDEGQLSGWLAIGLRRTVAGGTFTVILRADRMAEALAALPDRGTRVFPLWPRPGQPAKRVIIQVVKGSGAAPLLLSGLVLHRDNGDYTPEAEAVLRGEAVLARHFRGL